MWLRLDDTFPLHPKVAALSSRAFRLHVEGLCHACRHLTDGFVDDGTVRRILKATSAALGELDGGLWERVPGGFQIHDFLDYNASRRQIEDRRKKDRDRKGFQTDSAQIPDGIQTDSARIPECTSRPVPSRPQREEREEKNISANRPQQTSLVNDLMADDFARFWKPYPRKTNRAESLKAWTKLKPKERVAALDALPQHIAWWKQDGRAPSKIPEGSAWLNKRRWEDELPSTNNNRPQTKAEIEEILRRGGVGNG